MDIEKKRRRLEVLTQTLEDEKSWTGEGGHEDMQPLITEAARLSDGVGLWDRLSLETAHIRDMAALAKQEGEEEVREECEERMAELEKECEALRTQALLLSSPLDGGDCYLEIQAGAGGRESGDWVQMLRKMYEKWAAGHHDLGVETVHETWGENGGGLRSVLLLLKGPLAYGWSKTEAGVHRLVRISPFDTAQRRHTTFAQVRVYPASLPSSSSSSSSSSPAVHIDPKDLKIDTYRAQGAGGQHVNTTESAVRITHIPTASVVTCQADRSQHRNKAMALDVLRGRLLTQQQEKEKQLKATYTEGLGENGWGSQIRSYVLHPYLMIKDHRTGVEVAGGNVQRVLEGGDLDLFVEAALAASAMGEEKEEVGGEEEGKVGEREQQKQKYKQQQRQQSKG
ncbi:peptide chain release factor 2 [Nannochloropsis oceanica]